jgi:OOP family OmpA-OmpF porin
MRMTTILMGVALGVATPLAVAANPSYYVFADVGQSKVSKGCEGLPSSGTCKDNDVAIRAGLGYQFSNLLGFEGGYVDSGKVTTPNNGSLSSIKATEWQFAATGAVQVVPKFSLTGKAGMSSWKLDASTSSASANGNDFLLGAGARYDLDPSLSLRMQFETHKVGNVTTGRHDMNLLSMGLIAKF